MSRNGRSDLVGLFRASLPSEEDTNGVALHILRVADVYGFLTEDLILGKVMTNESVREMGLEECITIANVAAENMMEKEFIKWHDACAKVLSKLFTQIAVSYLSFLANS